MAVSLDRPARPASTLHALRRRPDLVALAVLLLGTFGALMFLGRQTLPIFDDWLFWAPPSTYAPDDLLTHYNGHAAALTRLLTSLSVDVGGSDAFLLHRMWAYAMHVATLGLLYFVAAPRIGRGLALVAIVPLTLMGLAWLHLLMPYSAIFQGPGMVGLLAAMLALQRESRRGDLVAFGALLAATFTATSGLAALAGIVVWLLWPPVQLRRLWVPGIPAVLWLAWYAGYKPDQGYEIQLLNDVSLVPTYVAEGLLHGIRTYGYLPGDWSAALAAALAILVVWVAARPGGMDRNLACAIAGAVAFWGIIAVGRGPELRVDQLRYLYPNAAHVVLIAVIAFGAAGVRSNRRTVLVAGTLALTFLLPSANQLRNTARMEREESLQSRAAITAAEIARDYTTDDYNPIFTTREDGEFSMGRYRPALEDARSIGYSEEELLAEPERLRRTADGTLLSALGIGLKPAGREGSGSCEPVADGGRFPVAAGTPVVVDNAGAEPVTVGLRRFASGPSELGEVGAGGRATIAIPRDRSDRPWEAAVSGGAVRVCTGG